VRPPRVRAVDHAEQPRHPAHGWGQRDHDHEGEDGAVEGLWVVAELVQLKNVEQIKRAGVSNICLNVFSFLFLVLLCTALRECNASRIISSVSASTVCAIIRSSLHSLRTYSPKLLKKRWKFYGKFMKGSYAGEIETVL